MPPNPCWLVPVYFTTRPTPAINAIETLKVLGIVIHTRLTWDAMPLSASNGPEFGFVLTPASTVVWASGGPPWPCRVRGRYFSRPTSCTM